MRRGRGRAHHRQRANARSTQRQYRQTPSAGIAEIHRPSRAVRGNQNRPAAYSLPSCRATTTRAHRLVGARTTPLRPRCFAQWVAVVGPQPAAHLVVLRFGFGQLTLHLLVVAVLVEDLVHSRRDDLLYLALLHAQQLVLLRCREQCRQLFPRRRGRCRCRCRLRRGCRGSAVAIRLRWHLRYRRLDLLVRAHSSAMESLRATPYAGPG
ncbi:hypothetical protein CAFEL_08725 [Corynebacterium afermentans subsp. lipophilum]|nr:hypothetical protein CAFEL_08725 [Corynebacterium afermentans subsp. lipophilum]